MPKDSHSCRIMERLLHVVLECSSKYRPITKCIGNTNCGCKFSHNRSKCEEWGCMGAGVWVQMSSVQNRLNWTTCTFAYSPWLLFHPKRVRLSEHSPKQKACNGNYVCLFLNNKGNWTDHRVAIGLRTRLVHFFWTCLHGNQVQVVHYKLNTSYLCGLISHYWTTPWSNLFL